MVGVEGTKEVLGWEVVQLISFASYFTRPFKVKHCGGDADGLYLSPHQGSRYRSYIQDFASTTQSVYGSGADLMVVDISHISSP
jgi:hypothetical protein